MIIRHRQTDAIELKGEPTCTDHLLSLVVKQAAMEIVMKVGARADGDLVLLLADHRTETSEALHEPLDGPLDGPLMKTVPFAL